MNIYILVEEGGEYSDWYHRNVMAFLTKEEAESYLKEQINGFNLFEPFCQENDYSKLEPYYSRWDKENLGDTMIHYMDFNIPPGTPNRRNLIKEKARNLEARRTVWAQNELRKDIDAALNNPNCSLSIEQKKLLIQSNFKNPYKDMGDVSIEEIPVKEGSNLWKMFNKN